MLLTEAEAKSRWCPMVRQADPQDNFRFAANRGKASGAALCIASGCAMWRWKTELIQPAGTTSKFDLRYAATDKGFCGLAGAPGHYEAVGDQSHDATRTAGA